MVHTTLIIQYIKYTTVKPLIQARGSESDDLIEASLQYNLDVQVVVVVVVVISAVEALIFFNTLINVLLTHPGPSRGRVGGKLHWAPRCLRGPVCKI